MFKRKSEEQGGNSKVACTEEKSDPIPRHIPPQSVTLTFVQRTFEEIAPGQLYYLPLCQTPKYMFDEVMKNQYLKYSNVFPIMKIHTPKFKMSNLIMLQDDIRVQAGTPIDTTAFTQVNYLIHYQPKNTRNYFKLTNVTDIDSYTGETLSYNLKPKSENKQLVTLSDKFSSFDNVIITPARMGDRAGFNPRGTIEVSTDYKIKSTYIPPTVNNPIYKFSGNLQPNEENAFLNPMSTVAWARNQDKITYYKYGDIIEGSINTNLEDVPLLQHLSNNIHADYYVAIQEGADYIIYASEWAYPGRHRPFVSRNDYFSVNLDAIQKARQFKPLSHHFFCMPPIRKPDGSLLGQRCSLTLEQEISITFENNQAIFTGNTEIDGEQMYQDDAVILRRNFYGAVQPTPGTQSPFCGNKFLKCEPNFTSKKNSRIQKAGECPANTWAGLGDALYRMEAFFKNLFRFTSDPPAGENVFGPYNIPRFTMDDLSADKEASQGWYDFMSKGDVNDVIIFKIEEVHITTSTNMRRYGFVTDGASIASIEEPNTASTAENDILVFSWGEFWSLMGDAYPGTTCSITPPKTMSKNDIQYANYQSTVKDVEIFFV